MGTVPALGRPSQIRRTINATMSMKIKNTPAIANKNEHSLRSGPGCQSNGSRLRKPRCLFVRWDGLSRMRPVKHFLTWSWQPLRSHLVPGTWTCLAVHGHGNRQPSRDQLISNFTTFSDALHVPSHAHHVKSTTWKRSSFCIHASIYCDIRAHYAIDQTTPPLFIPLCAGT